jgi:hypothetical protein
MQSPHTKDFYTNHSSLIGLSNNDQHGSTGMRVCTVKILCMLLLSGIETKLTGVAYHFFADPGE